LPTFTANTKFLPEIRFTEYFATFFAGIFTAYLLTIVFPQYLFAHDISYKNFRVYSNQPLDENIERVLDLTEAKLEKSPIYDKELTERIFICDSFALYTFLIVILD
jgi:hypothetical protein